MLSEPCLEITKTYPIGYVRKSGRFPQQPSRTNADPFRFLSNSLQVLVLLDSGAFFFLHMQASSYTISYLLAPVQKQKTHKLRASCLGDRSRSVNV